MLCEIDMTYQDYVIKEDGKDILYVHVTRTIYSLLVSAMLFYQKLAKNLIDKGYVINPYNPCIANKMIMKNNIL